LGNFWGLGRDSIINWRPWPPTSPLTVSYPSIGNYTVQLRDSNLCGVDIVNVTVSLVNPPVAGVSSPTVPLCQGTTVTFTNTSASGFSYRWNFGNGGGYVSRPFGTQTFTYNTPGIYTVSVVALIPGSGNACTDTAETVVTILPRPTANFSVSPNIGCNKIIGSTFTDNSIGASAWSWNFGNSNTFSGPNPPAQNYTTTGSFTAILTVTAANTCIHSYTAPIRVYQKPVASFIPVSACMLSSVTFTDNSSFDANDPITSWFWNFGDASPTSTASIQSPSHTYSSQNTYTVQLIVNSSHCRDTVDLPVTVNIKPTANYTVTSQSGCPALSVSFTNLSSNASNYLWNFNNGVTSTATNTSQLFTNTGTISAIYNVSLTAITPFSCTDTKTLNITVFPNPTSSYSSDAIAGCSPIAITFTNNSIGGISYEWNFGDGVTSISSALTITHPYTNTTSIIQSYTSSLVVKNSTGCKDSTSNIITVYPSPVFNLTMTPSNGCTPLNVNFSSIPGVLNYRWDFGDGSPINFSSNPSHVFTNTTSVRQTYTVELIATNAFSCADTTYGYPEIYPLPNPSFSITPNNGCSPLISNLINTTIDASTYEWNLGDGSANQFNINATHTYTNYGLSVNIHTITLLASNSFSCQNTSSGTVSVSPQPIANILLMPNLGCSPLNTIISNNSSGATTYTWNYGDGSPISNNFSDPHIFINNTSSSIIYTVQLISSNTFNCSDTTTQFVTVYNQPTPNYTYSPNDGCSPLSVTFTNSSALANNFIWKFGDGNTSIDANTINTYTNSGAANVTYSCTLIAITPNNCRDSIIKPITVFNKPIANFSVDTPACAHKLLNFTNTSIGGSNYEWDFGTTTYTSINVSQTFENNTNANIARTVQLVASSVNNCKDTIVVPIVIHPKPDFNIIANPDSGCTNLKVSFPEINGAVNYQWNFGDGNSSSSGETDNVYTNTTLTNMTYTVELIGSDAYGCKDTSYKVIKVFPKPTAQFQANPNLVLVPNSAVNCTNQSTGAESYLWNFGDGNTSSQTNPIHFYQIPGEFEIYLVATNSNGCKDTFMLPTKIVAQLESSIDVPNAFSPNPNGSNGGIYDPKDNSNDVFRPVINGIDKYELNIFSRWGELLFVSKDINIGWDGYYKGAICTQDLYIYKIIATTFDNKKIEKTGDLLLIR
jgi:gliding motility-associated-like protein